MAHLFRSRELPPKMDRVRDALAKIDIQVEPQQIITHTNNSSLIQARIEAQKDVETGRISLALLKMLYRLSPFSGGFCNLTLGRMHIQQNAATVMILHEAAHLSDSTEPHIRKLIDEVDHLQSKVTLKRPSTWFRYKIAEFKLLSLIEGRAKFCEHIASDDPKSFTFYERFMFKLSCNLEVLLALATSYLAIDSITLFLQNPIPVNYIDLVLGFFSAWVCTKLLPYVFGKNLVDAVHEQFDSKETLKLTAEKPPNMCDFFRPHRYARSLAEIQD